MISTRARIFNLFLKYVVKPLQAHGYIPPIIMRIVYFLAHNVAALWPIPRYVEIAPVNTVEARGEWVKIRNRPRPRSKKIVFYLHGGGYFFGSPRTHRNLTWRLSKKLNVDVFSLRYRLAPKHPIQTSVSDSISSYRWLLSQGYCAEDIVIGGDSAGGNLTLLTLQKIKELNLPMPTAAFCLSPLTDMASEGDSMVSNAKHDPMFHHRAMRYVTRFHARHHDDPRHPEISPVHSNFEGFPPLLLQVGSTEILLNDSERVAVSAREAGVLVELAVWHQMPHVFSLFGGIVPESIHGIREIAEFIGKHLFGTVSLNSVQHKTKILIDTMP